MVYHKLPIYQLTNDKLQGIVFLNYRGNGLKCRLFQNEKEILYFVDLYHNYK
jgi:hypothetical protein